MTNNHSFLLATVAVALIGCGPSCPQVMSGLDVADAMVRDAERLNKMAKKRRAAIAEAEQGGIGTFQLERIRFSVTAFEMAIETQARVIKAASWLEDVPDDQAAIGRVNEFRCFVDKILASDGHILNDGAGKKVLEYKVDIERFLQNEGTVTRTELRAYLEDGIEVETATDHGGADDDDKNASLDDEDEGAADLD